MSLVVTTTERAFKLNLRGQSIELSDPNPEWTPDRVMTFYEDEYPELTTAMVRPKGYMDDRLVFEFKTTVGTKG